MPLCFLLCSSHACRVSPCLLQSNLVLLHISLSYSFLAACFSVAVHSLSKTTWCSICLALACNIVASWSMTRLSRHISSTNNDHGNRRAPYLFLEQQNSIAALPYHYQAQTEVRNLSRVCLESRPFRAGAVAFCSVQHCARSQCSTIERRKEWVVTRCPR